jgi:hypothetical protein
MGRYLEFSQLTSSHFGNSDRLVAAPVKAYAQKNPHKLGAWPKESKTKIVHMHAGDFFGAVIVDVWKGRGEQVWQIEQGGAITGGLSMLIGVQSFAPHGGVFVFFAINPFWGFALAIAAGTVVTALIVVALKGIGRSTKDAVVAEAAPAATVAPAHACCARTHMVDAFISHVGGRLGTWARASVASAAAARPSTEGRAIRAKRRRGLPQNKQTTCWVTP